MPIEILHKIGKYLESFDYDKYISFSRYNEPLYDIEYLLKAIVILKTYAPNARMVTNTNGDFLNMHNIKKLNGYIDELTVMDYDETGRQDLINILQNVKIDNNFVYGNYKNMKVCINKNDFKVNHRGGILKEYKDVRSVGQCLEPLHFLGIDYNGNVMPCCNLRSDYNEHKKFILCNLHNDLCDDIIKNSKNIITELINCYAEECKLCNKIAGRYTRNIPSIIY